MDAVAQPMTLTQLGEKLLHRPAGPARAIARVHQMVKARPTDPPFPKDAKIAIIGAGPAGLTMAYELQKRGYQKVLLCFRQSYLACPKKGLAGATPRFKVTFDVGDLVREGRARWRYDIHQMGHSSCC